MDWEQLSQIATTFGLLVTAATVVTGFALYRVQQRDAYVAGLRAALVSARANSDRLSAMVSFELADELATSAVYSLSLEAPLERFYKDYVEPASPPKLDDGWFVHLFGPITVSLNTPLVAAYEELNKQLFAESARYQSDYPGLYRVLVSLATLYQNVLEMEKAATRDDDFWRVGLEKLRDDPRSRTLADFKHNLNVRLIQTSLFLATEARKEIGDLREMFTLVTDAYLAQSEAALLRVGRRERGEKLRPPTQTTTIPEDLREAEKALRHVLARDDQLTFREVSTRFESRREDDDDA